MPRAFHPDLLTQHARERMDDHQLSEVAVAFVYERGTLERPADRGCTKRMVRRTVLIASERWGDLPCSPYVLENTVLIVGAAGEIVTMYRDTKVRAAVRFAA